MFPKILVRAEWLAETLGQPDVVPLDIRGAGAFAAGHIPGAVAGWGLEEGAGGIRRLLAARGITGRETVVLYGGAGDHAEIGRFYWLLDAAGCAAVKVLDGGVTAWTAAGRPLASGPAGREPVAFQAPGRAEAAVDAGWVAESFDRPGVELLDVREAWRRGHVPHALPFGVAGLLPAGGGWPDPATVRRALSEHGPRPGDPVDPGATFVVYGKDEGDPRPGLTALLLRMAGFDVRLFPGGWQEWTAAPDRPVVRVVTAAEVADLLARENPGLARDAVPSHAVLLDLRTPRDFLLDHLPGARNLAWSGRFGEELERSMSKGWPGVDRATVPLVLYCYGTDCVRSRNGGTLAARLGFRNILWFRGGVIEWREAGYPLFESPLFESPLPGSP